MSCVTVRPFSPSSQVLKQAEGPRPDTQTQGIITTEAHISPERRAID